MLEELYLFHFSEAKQKGLSLILMPNSIQDIDVLTAEDKLHGVLTNLIKNAIKYTEKGSIKIGCIVKGEFIEFYVEDTGIGIPNNRLSAVFNRFEKVDVEEENAIEGSGLGLAISKAYVEMLDGDIFVESVVEEGSKFTFTIPFVKTIKKER